MSIHLLDLPSFCLFRFKFQNLIPAQVEHQKRCRKADDAAYAYIRQEMLGQVDA